MKVQFLGAVDCVTGSRHLVESASGKRILVDCGMFQGKKDLRLRNWEPFPVKADSIDAVILTHAHIDHSGYLPRLVAQGFRGPIFVTPATLDLCEILLLDSAHLHEEDANYANRKGFSKHNPALPFYTTTAAEESLNLFVPIDFYREFDPVDGFGQSSSVSSEIRAQFFRVGHILGAASVLLTVDGERILFSGDIGRLSDPILRKPDPRPTADYIVMEATYGAREHPVVDVTTTLERTINETYQRGGITLIPAFSVGRTQLVLEGILRLKESQRIPDLPVFLNSPMSIKVNSVLCQHASETTLSKERVQSICEVAYPVVTVEESRRLNDRRAPCIIVAANGMATGGRVLHHIRSLVGDPKHTILFTGYQAEGTRGARLLSGEPTIRIHGQDIPVRMEVQELENISAHADQKELLQWLDSGALDVKGIFLNHGEKDSVAVLKKQIEEKLKLKVLPTAPFNSLA